MNESFCTYCGHSLVPGTNICEGCGKMVPKSVSSDITTNSTPQQHIQGDQVFTTAPFMNQASGGFPPSSQGFPQQQQPNINDPKVKRNIVEFVNIKPRLLTLSELKDVFLAYLVIYIGFISRRLILGNIELFDAIFETVALILGIFGVWLIIDKLISYHYHLYPKFIYDPEKTLMSMIFAFFFIGFPPSYFRYRIWLKKLPKPNNIIKIQFLSNAILIAYGFFWYILLYLHSLPEIFLLFPFIIAISVAIGILPFGNFKLILTWNRTLYIILIIATLILFIISFPLVFFATI